MEPRELTNASGWLCHGHTPDTDPAVLSERIEFLRRLECVLVNSRAQAQTMLAASAPALRPKSKPEPPAPSPGGGGPVNRSPQAAKLDASRAWVLELAPWFAAALNDGLITPEHVDALAVALRRLSTRDQAKLLALDAEISAAATSQIPKAFGVTLQVLADRASGAVPADRIAQQRRQRSGRLYINADGMGCAYLQTDTDTHAEIEAVIETEGGCPGSVLRSRRWFVSGCR